jgi:DNA-binding NtrC family response regulator
MSDIEHELRSRVDHFVNELSALIRRQALQAVEEVLKKGEGGAAHARKAGRPAKAAPEAEVKQAKARGGAKAKPAAAAKRRAGEKRTPQQLAQITEQVFNYIKSNGGQGVEQIAKALGTSTKELTLPIRKLLADKKIGSKGQKRATRYFPR